MRYPVAARLSTRYVVALGVAVGTFIGAAAYAPAAGAAPMTLTVNSTDDVDDGACTALHCSFREAIRAANSNGGTETIAFGIPPGGPATVSPASALPTITHPVIIDGTT
jgi:CSLREA domain-containing protein